jgi:hypothetical protein
MKESKLSGKRMPSHSGWLPRRENLREKDSLSEVRPEYNNMSASFKLPQYLVISSRKAARNLADQGADFSSLALVEMTRQFEGSGARPPLEQLICGRRQPILEINPR